MRKGIEDKDRVTKALLREEGLTIVDTRWMSPFHTANVGSSAEDRLGRHIKLAWDKSEYTGPSGQMSILCARFERLFMLISVHVMQLRLLRHSAKLLPIVRLQCISCVSRSTQKVYSR